MPPLPQSADKSAICARLGLSDRIHKLLLVRIQIRPERKLLIHLSAQKEAEIARDALSSNPYNLTDQSKTDPSVCEPYRWDEISETAKHSCVLMVVRDACPETRPYYYMGCYRTAVNEENWVARWYLWHSFRYRWVNYGHDIEP